MKTVRLGCERLFDDAARLIDGRRVGLITNHSGVDRMLVATADRLHAYPHSQLVALFGPSTVFAARHRMEKGRHS